jgi:hypothetical protein
MSGLSLAGVILAAAGTVLAVYGALVLAVRWLKYRDELLERMADPRPTAAEIAREERTSGASGVIHLPPREPEDRTD